MSAPWFLWPVIMLARWGWKAYTAALEVRATIESWRR